MAGSASGMTIPGFVIRACMIARPPVRHIGRTSAVNALTDRDGGA
jgi:hypothetical protein